MGTPIDFCCDQNPQKWGKHFNGIKCISPEELFKIKEESTVFITVNDAAGVYKYLKENKVDSVNVVYNYGIVSSRYLSKLESAEIDKICQTYNILEDDKSRNLFRAIITHFIDTQNNQFILSGFSENNQYFPPDIISLSEHESFVDAGAYTGDTLIQFLQAVSDRFDNYYAFELDNVNFKTLHNKVLNLKINSNIVLYNKGVWSETTTINYSFGDLSSAIGVGEKTASVITLDEALAEKDVSFIKMDIEGAELDALKGAKNIIKRQKPALAICVYHNLQDRWEIPLYIKSLVPEYKIYLRHHSNYEYETVCYAKI